MGNSSQIKLERRHYTNYDRLEWLIWQSFLRNREKPTLKSEQTELHYNYFFSTPIDSLENIFWNHTKLVSSKVSDLLIFQYYEENNFNLMDDLKIVLGDECIADIKKLSQFSEKYKKNHFAQ